ncbi:MAG TPA: hypothetical protein VF306_06990 [Pirellulales bacterium]
MRSQIAVVGALFVVATTLSDVTLSARPDLAQLAQRGAATAERLNYEPASWTAVFENPTGRTYVKINIAPGKKRVVFSAAARNDEMEFARIIMREDGWYVLQGDRAAKYRTHEALLDVPSLYDYLARSNPNVATDDLLRGASFMPEENGAAFVRVPLSPAMRGVAQSMSDLLHRLESADGQGLTAQQRHQLDAVEDTLKQGERLGFDQKTGIVIRRGVHGQRSWITNFRWHDSVDEQLYSLAGRKWSDETRDFDLSHPEDVAMFNHCGMWRAGMSSGVGMTAVLLNLKSGRMRRVPYDDGTAGPGCFSLDGKQVFVSGALGEYGAMGVFQIDLANGSKRRLGRGPSRGSAMVFPTLSPDETTIAAVQTTARVDSSRPKSQIVLIDVSSGKVTELGDPLYNSQPKWLPDGTGLILGRWNSSDEKDRSTICRLDCATGALTELRPGAVPEVLRKSRRILFETRDDDNRWMTCDLDGSNARIAGGGLRGFSFPSSSSTGEEVLMMKAAPDGPKPYIVNPVTGKAKAVKVGKGLWAMPTWQ